MQASPKQPLAKGWDDILDVLARHDGAWRGVKTLWHRQKQPLAKGRPPIHTTTPKNNPLRRVPGRQKGTT